MDPDACLESAFLDEEQYSVGDLADWLEKGGRLPRPLEGEGPVVERVNSLLKQNRMSIIRTLRLIEAHLESVAQQDEEMYPE